LDRKLRDYTLPAGWAIVAAGNRESDRAVTTRMPTPLRNRFTHLTFEVDLQEWCEWAVSTSIRPEVIAFLRFKPELLSKFDRDANAFPSPRSWAFVSRILDQSPAPRIEHNLIAGTVGDGAATEFTAFLATFRNLPNIDAILLNPEREPVPDGAAAQFAVASALSYYATYTNFDRICQYLRRMPAEFGVLCVRDASSRQPDVRHTAAYTQWAIANHSVIA
jgi:MoxR-like ATPase